MAALPNTITIGDPLDPLFVFHNAETGTNRDGIAEVGGVFAVDVIGDELSIDTVTAVVQVGRPALPVSTTREVYVTPEDEIYISPGDENEIYYAEITNSGSGGQTGDISAVPYGTPFRWECDGRLIAAFYMQQPERVGRWAWRLTAVSGVGLLDVIDHVGGIYTGQTFQTVASSIIGNAFPFTVAPALADQLVYGWLPYDTARNNLHRLLIALGASMRRDANGEATFVFLTADSPATITDDRVALGGSVDYDAPATRAEVTEHAYFAASSDPVEELFQNTSGGAAADHTLVKFDGPYHDLTANGLTINESGVNYAIVTGTGTLTGKAYTHITRVVAVDAATPAGKPNVKHLRDDFTLVSLANSLNVATRILDYFSSARRVSSRIKLLGEKCGDVISVSDPFFDPLTAFIARASINASSNLLGSCELVEGYTPSHQGNNITGSQTLTGSGTWVSPFTGTLTVVVISGAQGGGAGNKGQNTPSTTVSSHYHQSTYGGYSETKYISPKNAKAGKGGQPGTPGAGGRIYVTTIEVTEGQEIAYNCGVGGAGEVFGSEIGHGADGTDTTFGSVSSVSGTVSPGGYIDPISGERVAGTGDSGIAGNDGTGWIEDDDGNVVLNTPAAIDVDGVLYTNGDLGYSYRQSTGFTLGVMGFALIGGFGGGAAYKANGPDGNPGNGYLDNESNPPVVSANAAKGGNGATALPPPKTNVIGQGGTSGNGGGGAGAVGTYRQEGTDEWTQAATWAEANGSSGAPRANVTLTTSSSLATGGDGSDGGDGGDGGIKLFWGA